MKHKHHIIPRHMGGTDAPSNLIELTIEEHAEAHRELYREHGCWEDKIAYQALEGSIGKEEIIFKVLSEGGKKGGEVSRIDWTPERRAAWSKYMMGNNKGNKRPDLAEYNTTHKKGKKQSPEQAAKSRENAMGNKSRVGQKRSAEELQKLSETLKAKYASGEMIHWTKRPEHAHRFKKVLD